MGVGVRARFVAALAVGSVAVLATLLAAAPALAQAPPSLTLAIPDSVVSVGAAQGKEITLRYGVDGDATVPDAVLTVDASAAADVLTLTIIPVAGNPNCAQSGAVFTCTSLFRGGTNTLHLLLRPTPAARTGTTATIRVGISAPSATPASLTKTFQLVDPRPDFQAVPFTLTGFVGEPLQARPEFRNGGSDAAGFVLRLASPDQPIAGQFGNCFYAGDREAVCPFPDRPVAAGQSLSVASPFEFRPFSTVPDVIEFTATYRVDPLAAGEPFDPGDRRRGSGPPLVLNNGGTFPVPGPDADPDDNVAPITMRASSNPADVAIAHAPARITGRPGTTVVLSIEVIDHGPSELIGTEGQGPSANRPWWPGVTLDLPPNVAVSDTPIGVFSHCIRFVNGVPQGPPQMGGPPRLPTDPRVRCFMDDDILSGGTDTAQFSVTILDAAPSAITVTASGGTFDRDLTNNVVRVEVNPSGGLPVTGDPAAPAALAGLLLVCAGGLAYVLAKPRRRRSRPA
jgi:hypothetical protein